MENRVAGVSAGTPTLQDGRVLDVANVVWCTGYHPGFSRIDLPVLGQEEPMHHRGVVKTQPGLYFVGLHIRYAFSSTMIYGVGRDAEYIAKAIASRVGVSVGLKIKADTSGHLRSHDRTSPASRRGRPHPA